MEGSHNEGQFGSHGHKVPPWPYFHHENLPRIPTNIPPPPLLNPTNRPSDVHYPRGDPSYYEQRYETPNNSDAASYNTPVHSQYGPNVPPFAEGHMTSRHNYDRGPENYRTPQNVSYGEGTSSNRPMRDNEYGQKRGEFNEKSHFQRHEPRPPYPQHIFNNHRQHKGPESSEVRISPDTSYDLKNNHSSEYRQTKLDQGHGHEPTSEDTKRDEQDWVNEWLETNKINHRLKETEAPRHSMDVPEAKRLFREAMQISEFLQNTRSELNNRMDDAGDVWEELWSDVIKKKARLEEIKSLLNGPTVKALSLTNLRTQAKREGLKKGVWKAYRDKQERREQKHRMADEWLAQIRKKDQDKKKEKELKKSADETLAEVQKKLNEAQKATELIKALTKLRQLRKEATERKGLIVPGEIESKFHDKTTVLSAMLEEQLKIYEAEKKTLEALLEQEAEESREKELSEKKKQLQELERRKERTIRRLLFGREVPLDPDDPMVQFRQYYEASNSSLEALLQTRKDWDLYLVPPSAGGSRIPEGWVVPPEPSSSVWASALRDRQTGW